MSHAIDTTHTIEEGMPTFPVHWHPVVEITRLGRHGIENRESLRLTLGTHTGTHMDAPRHFIPGATTIDAVPMDLLIGEAHVLDLSGCREKHAVGVSDLAPLLAERGVRRVILRFDWSDRWGTMEYFTRHPFLTHDGARWLIDRGVRMLGMDTPQVDSPDHGRGSDPDSPIHKLMLGQGCYFVENLCGLKGIPDARVEWIVMPLKIRDGDGAPCRSIVIVPKRRP